MIGVMGYKKTKLVFQEVYEHAIISHEKIEKHDSFLSIIEPGGEFRDREIEDVYCSPEVSALSDHLFQC